MGFERFDVVTVNGNNFIIINEITYNGKTYLYLINEDEENDDSAVVKVEKKENDTYSFSEVSDSELEIIISKLLIENKDEIKEITENNKEN